jgi:hypothetical protein
MIVKLVIFAVLPQAQITTAKLLLAELEKHSAQTKQRNPMFAADPRQQALIAHLPGVMQVVKVILSISFITLHLFTVICIYVLFYENHRVLQFNKYC